MCIVTAGGDDELHVDDVSDSDGAAADEDDDSDDNDIDGDMNDDGGSKSLLNLSIGLCTCM